MCRHRIRLSPRIFANGPVCTHRLQDVGVSCKVSMNSMTSARTTFPVGSVSRRSDSRDADSSIALCIIQGSCPQRTTSGRTSGRDGFEENSPSTVCFFAGLSRIFLNMAAQYLGRVDGITSCAEDSPLPGKNSSTLLCLFAAGCSVPYLLCKTVTYECILVHPTRTLGVVFASLLKPNLRVAKVYRLGSRQNLSVNERAFANVAELSPPPPSRIHQNRLYFPAARSQLIALSLTLQTTDRLGGSKVSLRGDE